MRELIFAVAFACVVLGVLYHAAMQKQDEYQTPWQTFIKSVVNNSSVSMVFNMCLASGFWGIAWVFIGS